QGIPHQLINNTVYVPADRKMEIVSLLGYSNALPKSFEDGFDSIIKEMNWLDPPEKTKEMFNRAKEQTLRSLFRQWQGITDADVVIYDTEQRNIGGTDIQPVATVAIMTDRNNRTDPRKLAESAANMVCGAKAGLLR